MLAPAFHPIDGRQEVDLRDAAQPESPKVQEVPDVVKAGDCSRVHVCRVRLSTRRQRRCQRQCLIAETTEPPSGITVPLTPLVSDASATAAYASIRPAP
ncbi:hypothetical protein [Amycolatopsis sp. NPDC051372]|uniref:hypothetical protein n=1 Tax=Amycolatopsis sp. NPDC051372 TaxID=3155669 RepID=UPI00343D0EB4